MAIVSLGLNSGQDASGNTHTLLWDDTNDKLILRTITKAGVKTDLTSANAFV